MNVSNRIFVSVFALLGVFCSNLHAQERSLDERINSVESTVSKLPKIMGDVNVRYRYDDLTKTNGFDVRRARIDLRGNPAKKLEYRIHFDFSNTPKLLDAIFSWKINDYVALQAGQYKIHFSLENPYNPNNLEMIDNAVVISSLVNYSDVSGLNANGRDIGLSCIGNFLRRDGFSIINYSIGLFNGQGTNTGDANKSKDFSGIFTVNPVKPLSLAVSHYNGLQVRQAQSDIVQRVRTGVGAKYDDGRLLVRSEYIQGKTGNFKSEGAYATAGYFVHPKIQPVLRYDYFKRNMNDNSTRQQNYVVGFNYFLANNVRFQLNYTYRKAHESDSNLIVTQIWVKF